MQCVDWFLFGILLYSLHICCTNTVAYQNKSWTVIIIYLFIVFFLLSDQTPTPTRFLKNCEEVGLFSELDCSIEQEFCKAQEEEDSKQVLQINTKASD